jgi:hypothetical protein
MALVPDNVDPEYSVEESKQSPTIHSRNNNATIPLFCTHFSER